MRLNGNVRTLIKGLKDFQDFCQTAGTVEFSGSLTAEQKSWKSFNPENQGSDKR